MSLTAGYMKVDDAYIGFVEEIPGERAQGDRKPEMIEGGRMKFVGDAPDVV